MSIMFDHSEMPATTYLFAIRTSHIPQNLKWVWLRGLAPDEYRLVAVTQSVRQVTA